MGKKNFKNVPIAPNTLLKDLFRAYPSVKEVFLEFHMDCLHCKGLNYETIRHAAENHGIRLKELMDEIKKKLNLEGGEQNKSEGS